jgi:ribosomal protein L37E
MALLACKECGKQVSTEAESCPHCGVPNPTISYEEQRLEAEIDRWAKEESRQADLYIAAKERTFLWFGWKTVDHHVNLANEAQRKKRDLTKQLFELRQQKLQAER